VATITAVPATGNTALTYTAATAGGDTISGGSAQRTTLLVRNGGATITLTIVAVNACSQGFLHNVIVTCAGGDTDIALPANAETAAGNYALTYSSVTTVTVAAVNT
jgi:hypothetical protein